MKLSTIKNKLTKLGLSFKIVEQNSVNSDIVFTMNGIKVEGWIDSGRVTSFTSTTGYNNDTQETERRIFSNFSSMSRYANRVK